MRKLILVIFLAFIMLLSCKQECPEVPAEAKLYFKIGQVQVNQQDIKVGHILKSGDKITTGDRSSAELLLGENSALQVRANSIVQLDFDNERWRVDAQRGAILNMVERNRSYQVTGPTAVLAVRGTIFYVNSYDDSTQYNCTCNGTVEIDYGTGKKTVSASHHEGFTTRPGDIQPESMKEHDDLQIFDFMYRMDEALKVDKIK